MRCEVPIRGVRVQAYTVPTDRPEADGTIAWDSTTLVLVEIEGGGKIGLGYTYSGACVAGLIRDKLAAEIKGKDAMAPQACFEAMQRAVRNLGREGLAATAISAVDTALYDLKARLLDLPLVRLLGARRDSIPVYGSGGFTTYHDTQLTDQLTGWVRDQGIPRVKIKIGESWGTDESRDLARIRKARTIIGPDVELYVDANGGYTAAQAIRVGHAMADQDVRWFEEPVSSDDLDGLRRVRDAVAADVTAGEYGYDLPYFARMVGTVDCLQADVSRCGGISEWQRVAALAAAHNLQVSGHCAPALHVDAALATPNLRHLEWFHDHTRIESMLFDGVTEPDPGGVLRPDPSVPGNGLTFKAADAEKYRI